MSKWFGSMVGLLGLFGLLAAFEACSGSVSGGACSYSGQRYAVGESFPASDGCNQCSCGQDGDVACTAKACISDGGAGCVVDGKRYTAGERVSSDGCNSCVCLESGELGCTGLACVDGGSQCDSLVRETQAALADVQSCKSAAECGQPIVGSSCGGTRDLVARKNADLTEYTALKKQSAELGCETEGGSTCDIPEVDGFACIDNVCTWNYVKPEPQPTCEPFEAAELCVRGKPTADGELLEAGEPLQVSVRSAGCLSSSCSKVVEASCSITAGQSFAVKANFCVADTSKPGQGCTADCGVANASCSFGQPLTAGDHQVKLGSIAVGFQVPSKLPSGGLCASTQ
jgi:hypothetical protein